MAPPTSPTSRTIAVSDLMHSGVISCPPETPFRDVASLMSENTAHCVVVDGLARGPHHSGHLVWGTVSDVELMRAVASGRLDGEAGEAAIGELVTVSPDESMERAAQIMGEQDCSHLIVVATDSGKPLGVISSLDIARGIAWGSRK
jgi:CBS domain-containing protein